MSIGVILLVTVGLFIAALVGFLAAAIFSAASRADLIEDNERLQRELARERRKGR